MNKILYAEDTNYWDTVVHPTKSLAEVQVLLEDFGSQKIQTITGVTNGNTAYMVRFELDMRTYRFLFRPLTCRYPDKMSRFGTKPNIKTRQHKEQAVYQMGRRAYFFVKGLLTAALDDQSALFGFLELPAAAKDGYVPTVSEIDVSGIVGLLPELKIFSLGPGEK